MLVYYNREGKEHLAHLDDNKIIEYIDKRFCVEYNLTWESFKNLWNDDYIRLDYDDLVDHRFHEQVLEYFKYEIEDQYQEELRLNKEIEKLNLKESKKC